MKFKIASWVVVEGETETEAVQKFWDTTNTKLEATISVVDPIAEPVVETPAEATPDE